jgi:hypothetical protein
MEMLIIVCVRVRVRVRVSSTDPIALMGKVSFWENMRSHIRLSD